MVDIVSSARLVSSFKSDYQKFKGGTHAFVEIIGFSSVIDYPNNIGRQKISDYEEGLLHYAAAKFLAMDRVRIIGSAPQKEPLISFALDSISAKKAETWFNEHTGIVLRAGQLSAQPLMKSLALERVLRISFGYFNTHHEVDQFIEALQECIRAKG